MANHHVPHNEVAADEVRIPVIQEELHVGKRLIETGRGVRVQKTVSEEIWRVDESLLQQTLQIEHVPKNAWIEGAPPVNRYEGNTLVMPVLEEVLVVEKRLRLKEEIRITAQSHQQPVSERVVLRTEHVSSAHFDDGGPATRSPPSDA